MDNQLPEVKHIYQNHHLDSTRWNHYSARDADIVIATPYKSGTTWMQNIVMHLVFQDFEPRLAGQYSPWLDMRLNSLEEVVNNLEGQQHRRFIKTHLPLDGLPFYPQVKYIVVSRDARDVFMSLWNHYSNYTQEFYEAANDSNGLLPLPICPANIREFWKMWITKGWFEWESEGYPFWSNLRHVQTWWNYKHLPNILLVHFNDLLQDLAGEIRRIAAYLEIALTDDALLKIVEATSFDTMKQNIITLKAESSSFKGGMKTFFYKGTNGRWHDVLTEDDLNLYDAAVQRELTPDCAEWLENGRLDNL